MQRLALAALVTVAAFVPALQAEDKAVAKLTGTWTRKLDNDVTITFTFKGDKANCEVVTGSGASIVTQSSFGVTEEGTLFGILTKVEKTGTDNGPEKGELIGFDFKVEKDKMTITNYKGSADRPEAKQVVEGDYEKKGK